MRKLMFSKLTAFFLSVVLMTGLSANISEGADPTVIASGPVGSAGPNLSWKLWDNGVLEVTGTGEMWDFLQWGWDYDWDLFWFDVRDRVTSVVINEGVTSVGYGMFNFCLNLVEVKIPASVTYIGIVAATRHYYDCAFRGCVNLTSIDVDPGNQNYSSVGGVLFDKNETALIFYPEGKAAADYVVPASVTTVCGMVFSNRNDIVSVDLPNVTTVGPGAFNGCENLTRAYMPKVVSIEEMAFGGCGSLTNVYMPKAETISNEVFGNCVNLAYVNMPSVTVIEDYAFYGCAKLNEVYIGTAAPPLVDSIHINPSAAFSGVAPGARVMVPSSWSAYGVFENSVWHGLTVKYHVMPKITVPNITATAGRTVEVPVIISNNPGVATVRFTVAFNDEYLTLDSVTDGGLLGEEYHSGVYGTPYTFYWENATINENITNNGTIASLRFTVPQNTPAGVYDISLSYEYSLYDIIDVDMKPVFFSAENGSIEVIPFVYGNVSGSGAAPSPLDSMLLSRRLANWPGVTIFEPAADVDTDGFVTPRDAMILRRHIARWAGYEVLPYVPQQTGFQQFGAASGLLIKNVPSIMVSSASGNIGDIVEINVGLKNNPGIAAMRLNVNFDAKALRLVGVEDKGVLGAQTHGASYASPYILYWENGTSLADFVYSGDVATLRFEILSAAGSPVVVSYDNDRFDILNAALNTVNFEISGGGVSVKDKPKPAALVSAETSAKNFSGITETEKNSKSWVLSFTVTETYSDGKIKVVPYSININSNNANIDGAHDLGAYTLVYDIKGSGSNVKEFKVIMN